MKKKVKKILKSAKGKVSKVHANIKSAAHKKKIIRDKNPKQKYYGLRNFLSAVFHGKPVPRGKISKMLWAKIFFTGICLLVAIFLTYIIGIKSFVEKPYDFEIVRGQTVSSVARGLVSDNIIISEDFFKASVLFFGGGVQSGNYELPVGASTWKIAKMLSRGDITAITILIPEGATVKQIKQILYGKKDLCGTIDCDTTYAFDAVDKDLGIDLCKLKDGDLFPDTYRVAKGTERTAVLKLAKKKMDKIRIGWQENSRRFMPEPLQSWNQIMTLASIVQKETPRASEMPVVASVYLNRLKKKMRLQADPTVVYAITNGLGDMQGRALFLSHLKFDSPYNTYKYYGLPPLPIANVGRDAIFAVLNPADTNYLYFVADGTGGHKFADTYAEHQKNRNVWRKIKKSFQSK